MPRPSACASSPTPAPAATTAPALQARPSFLDMTARRRLLARGMSFKPDAVIANGDHIYWDVATSYNKPHIEVPAGTALAEVRRRDSICRCRCCTRAMRRSSRASATTRSRACTAPRCARRRRSSSPTTTTRSRTTSTTTTWRRCRPIRTARSRQSRPSACTIRSSCPTRTCRVAAWQRQGRSARRHQHHFRHAALRQAARIGVLRLSALRRLQGRPRQGLPQWAEDWLIARTRAEDTAHFFHVPSLPFGYSSGKLGDWYPDLLDEQPSAWSSSSRSLAGSPAGSLSTSA